jgi:hypothetical protein
MPLIQQCCKYIFSDKYNAEVAIDSSKILPEADLVFTLITSISLFYCQIELKIL